MDRLKAKFYKRHVDPDFELTNRSHSKSSKSATEPTHAKVQEPNRSQPPRPTTMTPPQPKTTPSTTKSFKDYLLAFATSIFIIFTLLTLQPLNRYLSFTAFQIAVRLSLAINTARLISKHHYPSSLSAIQPWLLRVSPTTELFYILLSGIITTNHSLWAGLLPMAIISLYHLSTFLTTTPFISSSLLWKKLGQPMHTQLIGNQPDAMQLCALLEISIGFQAIVSALLGGSGIRGMMQCYVLWGQLRSRYWSHESRVQHVAAWAVIAQKTAPYTSRIWVVQNLIDWGSRWFQQPMMQPQ